MAFSDALDLRTAVVEAVQDPNIVDVWPRLVKLGESTINRRCRAREQATQAALTVSGGYAYLPGDYMEAIGLFDSVGAELVQQPLGMTERTGTQAFYSVDSDRINAAKDGAYTLRYYASLPTLSGSFSASNWALLRWPNLYLYAVAAEAARYLRNPEMAGQFDAMVEREIAGVAAQDARARFSRARVRFGWVTP